MSFFTAMKKWMQPRTTVTKMRLWRGTHFLPSRLTMPEVLVMASGSMSSHPVMPMMMYQRLVRSAMMSAQSNWTSMAAQVSRCVQPMANAQTPRIRRYFWIQFHPVSCRMGVTKRVSMSIRRVHSPKTCSVSLMGSEPSNRVLLSRSDASMAAGMTTTRAHATWTTHRVALGGAKAATLGGSGIGRVKGTVY